MPATVLIASPEHLPALKEREDLGGAQVFSDVDALRALDVITRQRPDVIALERLFAATSRGAALINRIKADPSLSGCEIRIVAHDSAYSRVSRKPGDHQSGSAAAAVAEAPPSPAAAALVDLSLVGAHVVSPTILKPNQRLRISLPDAARTMRFSGAVAWASFEIPKGGAPRYRAGIEFFDADQTSVGNFIETNTKKWAVSSRR